MNTGRNDRCPCGSGDKYKHCCGRLGARVARQAAAGNAPGHVNLGNELARRGRMDEAAASYRRALALDPGLAEAHHNLGTVLLESGHVEESLEHYRCAIVAKPAYAEAHGSAGDALMQLERAEEAIVSYQCALDIRPAWVVACHSLANALAAVGRTEESLAAYGRALALDPNCALLHNNLGSLLRGCGRLDEAAACFRRSLELDPGFAEAQANLGLTQRLQSRPQEARTSCLRALELKPNFVPALTTLAESYADTGDFAGAERCFRQAAAVDRDSPQACAGLSRLRKMTRADSDWLVEAQRIAALSLPPRQEACLRYAMGKYFDDLADFEHAFDNFRRANELTKFTRAAYRPEAMTRVVDRIIETEDREWLGRTRVMPTASERAVFVVGMLRSGTTLAEQILAAHPQVFGAGELPFWGAAAETIRSAADHPGRQLRLERMAVMYLDSLASLACGAQRVVDKMPANFLSLGLIYASLPNARVIHLRRHPLDTCLSIYFQHLETALSYTNDLGDLARYYSDYARIMEHWHAIFPPGFILDVPYEALVQDPESWSRRMIEHIGLPWDPCCLDYRSIPRTVITASKWQVRQPITTAAVGRWKNYRAHLGPLMELLAPGTAQVRA
ncbi:MAG: sulfotransferase [Steroidobacteraceae bacterium]